MVSFTGVQWLAASKLTPLHLEPTDSTAAKKRAEAIEALTKIEIQFAQIRDLLYLEKIEEVARERWQIEAGALAISIYAAIGGGGVDDPRLQAHIQKLFNSCT